MSHYFGSKYARKPIKGSKDSDHNLVSKKILSQKNGSLGWGPGPGKFGQKTKTCPPYDVTHRKPKSQTKNLILNQN